MEHKAGFVNIIGNPNVGKSTLMNALMDHDDAANHKGGNDYNNEMSL